MRLAGSGVSRRVEIVVAVVTAPGLGDDADVRRRKALPQTVGELLLPARALPAGHLVGDRGDGVPPRQDGQRFAISQLGHGARQQLLRHRPYFKRIGGLGNRIEIALRKFRGVRREIDIAQADLARRQRGRLGRDASLHALTVMQLVLQQGHRINPLPAVPVVQPNCTANFPARNRTDQRKP